MTWERVLSLLARGFHGELVAELFWLEQGESTLNDVHRVWWVHDDSSSSFEEFVEDVTGKECYLCDYCEEWSYADGSKVVYADETYCESCADEQLFGCPDCNELAHRDTGYSVWSGGPRYVCSHCAEWDYHYCDHCDEYYHVNDGHTHDCGCEAPNRKFRFPANGDGWVDNDQSLTVELPAGTIDAEGLWAIRDLLRRGLRDLGGHAGYLRVSEAIDAAMGEIGDQWQTKQGNYTKRLSRTLYSKHQLKVPPDVLTEVGNVARQHSSTASAWEVQFTRDLNLSAADFVHESSCWWGSESESRCALKSWGGIGMRTFDEYGTPTGRAWVQPLNAELQPTHDTENAHAYIVFNGYGELEGYTPARILAHLTGKTYTKVGYSPRWQYVNGAKGWLVADEETCREVPAVDVFLDCHDTIDAHEVRRATEGMAA